MKKKLLFIIISTFYIVNSKAQTTLVNEQFEYNAWDMESSSIAYTNFCGSASGVAAYFETLTEERWIKTYELNVSEGGDMEFYFFMPYQSSGYCDAPEAGEDVYVEYSIDKGQTWINLYTLWAGYVKYSTFTKVSLSIPQDARTHSTIFRWTQPIFTPGYFYDTYDHWALDNLMITSYSDCALSFFMGTDSYDYISGISLNNMSTSNNGFLSSTFYSDYTNISTSLNLNNTYTLTVNGSGSDYETFGAWIDYDNDGLFESSEKLGEAKSNGGKASITFTVPASAKTGNTTTLRVISQEDYTSNLDPCGIYNYGEAEDYSVIINSNNSGIIQNNFDTVLLIYPNPAQDILFIEYPGIEKNINFSIEMLNINGQVVISERSENMKKYSINTGTLEKGIYFLRIQSQNNVMIQKVEIH